MAVYGYGCLCMSVYSYVYPYRPVRINHSGHFMGHTWTTYLGPVSVAQAECKHRYPKLYGRLDRVTFDRYATAKL